MSRSERGFRDARVDPVPYRLRIGVTGHRALPDDPALVAAVARAVHAALSLVPRAAGTEVRCAIVSPLAEGADRLVARVVLAVPEATLEVVLPMPAGEYEQDFQDDASRREFAQLRARAARIVELPPAPTREEAYAQAGDYVVARCDVLIAVWDGARARGLGGTAEVVAAARDRGIPVLWVDATPPYSTTEWLGNGIDAGVVRQIERYNRATVDGTQLAATLARTNEQIDRQAAHAGIDLAVLAPYLAWILPAYARTDLLAGQAQRRFFRAGDATYVLAALAVLASAGPQLFRAGAPFAGLRIHAPLQFAPLIECVLMALVLALIYARPRQNLHRRWIAQRFLAERLRSALFMALVSAQEDADVEPAPVSLHQPTDAWIERVFDEIWLRRPVDEAAIPVQTLRAFLARAWIADQRAYHAWMSARHQRASRAVAAVSVAIFVATFCIAALHAVTGEESDLFGGAGATIVLYLSIVLPALAGALGGIDALRERPRNAYRSENIAHHLAHLQRRMEHAADPATLRALARHADAMMLEESGAWFVTMQFRDVQVHG